LAAGVAEQDLDRALRLTCQEQRARRHGPLSGAHEAVLHLARYGEGLLGELQGGAEVALRQRGPAAVAQRPSERDGVVGQASRVDRAVEELDRLVQPAG